MDLIDDSPHQESGTLEPGPGVDIELIYYLNNNEKENGRLNFTHLNDENNRISYKDITFSFYLFLKGRQENEKENLDIKNLDIKQNNINYESIRYYDGQGWVSLKETEVIFLDDELTIDTLIIIIYAKVFTEDKMNLKNKYDKVGKEIDYIYTQLTKEKNNNLAPNAPLNLVVLTANPLMDGKNELRTMNDFNIIKSEIYKAFNEEDYLKYTEFYPLTINIFKDILSDENKRPVILHLICKSTYIIPKDVQNPEKDSDNYINLIFEKDNNYYNLEFIDKIKLQEEIFDKLDAKSKENIEKITLIISTPFAEDVYNLFKDFKFKNLLIQHTTLADVNFVANFNYTFYKDIITHLDQPINNIYQDALNVDLDKKNPPKFCCCFHKHKKECNFLKNYINEIYMDDKANKEQSKDTLENLIPHFYHLFPDCSGSPTCSQAIDSFKLSVEPYKVESGGELPENSFCCHRCICSVSNNFQYLKKPKRTTTKIISENNKKSSYYYYNFCCCDKEPKSHNINSIFKKDFSAKEKNNEIRFRNAELMKEMPNIPNYEKMILFVGKNKVIYDVIKFFFSNEMNLNIYGDNIENLKKLGSAIIEYYKEKFIYVGEDKKGLVRNKSSPSLSENKENDKNNDVKINPNISINYNKDIDITPKKSTPFIPNIEKIVELNFIEINLNDNEIETLKDELNNIYFIYVYKLELKDKIKIRNSKIIWFTKEKIDDKKIKLDKKIDQEFILRTEKQYFENAVSPNEYIKFQNTKTLRNYWRRKKV